MKISKSKIFKKFIIEFKFIYITCFLAMMTPYISGDIFNTSGFGSKRVNLPDYYYDLKDYLNNSINNQNILILPHSQINIWNLDWSNLENGYGGQYPLNIDLNHTFFNFYKNSKEEYQISKFLNKPNDLENLKEMNVTSIIIHYDFNYNLMESQWYYSPSNNMFKKIQLIEEKLTKNEKFIKKKFGNLILFTIIDEREYKYPIEIINK